MAIEINTLILRCLLAGFLWVLSTGHALSEEAEEAEEEKTQTLAQTLVITSDRLEMDDRTMTVIFHGSVEAVEGEIHLFSDKMTVYYEGNNKKKIREVVAKGDVIIEEPGRRGEADEAWYDIPRNRIDLVGKGKPARVLSGKDLLEGEKIFLFLNNQRKIERVWAEGGEQRVTARFSKKRTASKDDQKTSEKSSKTDPKTSPKTPSTTR